MTEEQAKAIIKALMVLLINQREMLDQLGLHGQRRIATKLCIDEALQRLANVDY